MKILISNDDGVQAPGLACLARALSTIADITVVAPERNRSGASNSLTLHNPLRVQRIENGFYSVAGTPTDCVHLAITGMLDEEPDMVVSGINAGSNLGDDVFYSGTVAAAMEGRFLGLPAMAVSLGGDALHYETAAAVAKNLVVCLQKNPLPSQTILNINIPDVPIDELQGFDITRLGTRHRAEKMLRQVDPRGQPIYWVGLPGPEQDAGLGTDFYAINNNRVSITPLQLDLTHYQAFDKLAAWIQHLEL
jgi:5'-nucleotidase